MTEKQKKIWAGFIGTFLFAGVAVWLHLLYSRELSDVRISDEVNRYLTMEFVPRYHIRDCVIKFEVVVKNDAGNFSRNMDKAFWKYINDHEPEIGFMTYAPNNWPDHYLYFADQCDRKEEIFAGMTAYVDMYFGTQMAVRHLPFEGAVEPFGSMWLDSPNYSPENISIWHKAVRKDGRAFLNLAENLEAKKHEMRHVYYTLAEHYLPEGDLKKEATRAKEALQASFTPERLERQMDAIQDWVSKIDRYNTN